MNPFQLGFRNLIGILMPGAVLLLVLAACLEIFFPGIEQVIRIRTGNNASILFGGLLLLSYILGYVIRLHSADAVDSLSASLVCIRHDPFKEEAGSIEDHLDTLRDEVADPNFVLTEPENDKIRWAWKYDEFPYPVWELMKLRLYHPHEMFLFFLPYKRCFATGGRRGKEFFNYCKAVIYQANEGKRHALAEEVQSAEAHVRFLAGIFLALVISSLALLVSALWITGLRGTFGLFFFLTAGTLFFIGSAGVVVQRTEGFSRRRERVFLFWFFSAIAVALLIASVLHGVSDRVLTTGSSMNLAALCMLWVAFAIVSGGRFRVSRLKEVDTVFDAFFLVHRHASACSECCAERPPNPATYDDRQKLMVDAFSEGLSLETLVRLMRNRSVTSPGLSSMYFAGADRDHPYFLHTDRVAIGLSVLPEDEPKSRQEKRHPHQHEVIFLLDGSLRVEIAKDGKWEATDLTAGQIKIINPDECHRIVSGGRRADFLFVKTLPAKEPRGVPCSQDD